MWHDLYCIAQEFTVWKRWGGYRQLGAHPFFRAVYTQDVRFQPSSGNGGQGKAFMIPAWPEW